MEKSPTWYALYVKPRHEFLVQSDLAQKGREVYLPVVNRVRQWKDRKKQVDFPIFPGYLFARVMPNPDDFLYLVKLKGVVRILATVPGQPTAVPDDEIEALKSLLASKEEVDIYPELQKGKTVRITRGIFKNVEGIISRKGAHYFLHINISLLGRCVAVKILADDVEPL